MACPKYFDAHNHIQNYSGPREAGEGSVELMLLNGTAPDDWQKVLDLAAADKRVLPCFGLHPWFINKAGPLWLEELELFLRRAPSCVGEIGLDGAKNADTERQEEVFTAQLKLAAKLSRPACLHCVKAWGRMLKIIKEELPGTFMLHSYGGPAEMIKDFFALGAYFSFGAAIMDPKRRKLRKALLIVPPERLLFETEPSSFAPALLPGASKRRGSAKLLLSEADPPVSYAPGLSLGPQGMAVLISAAAVIMGRSAESLAELSWANGIKFLGDIAAVRG
jgi:TatD DNase family protein